MRLCKPAVGIGIAAMWLAAASAADLPPVPPAAESAIGLHYAAIGRRVAPLVIYDYRPGVVVRAYWRAPWRHRHYFPTSDEPPRVGREEDLSAAGAPPEPAESFSRSWSTSSVFLPERPRQPEPLPEPPLK